MEITRNSIQFYDLIFPLDDIFIIVKTLFEQLGGFHHSIVVIIGHFVFIVERIIIEFPIDENIVKRHYFMNRARLKCTLVYSASREYVVSL